jgi:hypothetical protein
MPTDQVAPHPPTTTFVLALAWLAVGLPLTWGIAMTVSKALALFR